MALNKCPMIGKLTMIGSVALSADSSFESAAESIPAGRSNAQQLIQMLREKNGFYAFESALHVFPLALENQFHNQDLWRWNSPNTWKYAYGDKLQNAFCFAEDIFAYQFCLVDTEVGRFDPETGNIERYCHSVEDWARRILEDFRVSTGYPLAHEWQAINGPLKPGNRLVPIYPFMSKEGSYSLANLYELNSTESLLVRASLARQLFNVADGETVRIVTKNIKPRTFQ